jgi:hypothetical protein
LPRVNAFQELERQDEWRRERQRRRVRRRGRWIFSGWAVVGLLRMFAGDPFDLVLGVGLFCVGAVGALLVHRQILREAPDQSFDGTDD